MLQRIRHKKQQNRANQERWDPKYLVYQNALRAEEEHSEETG
jgi:hypothetical protein